MASKNQSRSQRSRASTGVERGRFDSSAFDDKEEEVKFLSDLVEGEAGNVGMFLLLAARWSKTKIEKSQCQTLKIVERDLPFSCRGETMVSLLATGREEKMLCSIICAIFALFFEFQPLD